MLRDALKVSEMRKKVAKEPSVPVLQLENLIIMYIKITIINYCSHSSVGRALDW